MAAREVSQPERGWDGAGAGACPGAGQEDWFQAACEGADRGHK